MRSTAATIGSTARAVAPAAYPTSRPARDVALRPRPTTIHPGQGPDGTAPDEEALVEAGIARMWADYAEAPDDRVVRDRLVLHYAPLVKYVAGRVGTGLPSHVDVADLVQCGIFGLVDAIERFEPDRGRKFEVYAMQRIRGAILDELRSQDWVPRSVRSRAREIERAIERRETREQRSCSDAEIADELGMETGELRSTYGQIAMTSVAALDELVAAGRSSGGGAGTGAGAPSLADSLPDAAAEDPVAAMESRETRRLLADAIGGLAERDRTIVGLYYFENLTLAEIGKVLGVTESRVCQLHTRAVLRLRARLAESHAD
ncbi:FliA/WhiG family RNA polymerase sigma factor [Actinomycetospora soli]|uniref:FliA/WhiG family RNA polymerase sigma factor n=1 Tax=Actinomycetospora soli TaxID=2893887 RepID=UPI001E469A22|nr:FliA/WhiG family RNA polymerase sigma factor [Actinomycetospora soli]MCD2189529.1 FliA/WhiG family RNA polymerase sigma factor [Actinomycetospora soli]